LKIKKAKIELETAEIEKEMLIEKLKSDKEQILEHELNQ